MTESGAATTGIIGATCCRIICRSYDLFVSMKLVIAATGASGTIYLQRLLAQIDSSAHEVRSGHERVRKGRCEAGAR